MLQLNNKTPFAANIALFPNEQGVDSLYVIVKASFNVGKQWTLLEEQVPPQQADEYLEDPITSSLSAASDFHIGKAGTDIIMLGSAYAIGGKAVRVLDVELEVGNKSKRVRVFGDRMWQDREISQAQPFEQMPLIYEKAFGGVHSAEGGEIISVETRNPVGRGYLGDRNASALDGQALPNLEDPENLIQSPADSPSPACFAYVASNWQPRVEYAGTYDEVWKTQRAPYLPHDFQRRFLNTAHPDLICNGFLEGGENVKIIHMHPGGNIQFRLPRLNLIGRVDVAGQIKELVLNMETLILKPNDLQISMVWKAEYPCDKQTQNIREITLSLAK